jgi:pSer/pThr/pTyr-binding forkhead associated (FHA) protein
MLTHVILTATGCERGPSDFVFAGHEQVTIGRGSDCSLRLTDPTVSRHHCLLDAGDEAVLVRDLRSLNGTYVNGQRVGGRMEDEDEEAHAVRAFRELHNGDQLKIGARTFWVRLVDEEPHDGEAAPVRQEPCVAGA